MVSGVRLSTMINTFIHIKLWITTGNTKTRDIDAHETI